MKQWGRAGESPRASLEREQTVRKLPIFFEKFIFQENFLDSNENIEQTYGEKNE